MSEASRGENLIIPTHLTLVKCVGIIVSDKDDKEVKVLETVNETIQALGTLLLGIAALIEATRRIRWKRKKKKKQK